MHFLYLSATGFVAPQGHSVFVTTTFRVWDNACEAGELAGGGVRPCHAGLAEESQKWDDAEQAVIRLACRPLLLSPATSWPRGGELGSVARFCLALEILSVRWGVAKGVIRKGVIVTAPPSP